MRSSFQRAKVSSLPILAVPDLENWLYNFQTGVGMSWLPPWYENRITVEITQCNFSAALWAQNGFDTSRTS